MVFGIINDKGWAREKKLSFLTQTAVEPKTVWFEYNAKQALKLERC